MTRKLKNIRNFLQQPLFSCITIFLVCGVLLAGCSSIPRQSAFLDFSLSKTYTVVYSQDKTAVITTRDTRNMPEVISFTTGNTPSTTIIADPP